MFLPMVMPAVLNGLKDHYDDVRAIAAASLLPVAKQLPTLLPKEVIKFEQFSEFNFNCILCTAVECDGHLMG